MRPGMDHGLSGAESRSLPPLALGALLTVSFAKLALHLISNAWLHYDFSIDEFYYIACGEHLGWGYVDHPPLAPLLIVVSRTLFGDSLFAVRLLPALAGGLTVFLSGVLARELGGRRWAQALAALATFAVPIFFSLDTFFSMNAFRPLFWTGGFILVAKIIRTGERKWWYWLGPLLGVGVLNKLSMLWFGGGLAVGMLATGQRRWFADRGPWICAATACAIFAPHVAWQMVNNWPTVEWMRTAYDNKLAVGSIGGFLIGQSLTMNPLLMPLWVAGLFRLLLHREGRRFALLGVLFLAVSAFLIWNGKARPDYLSPAYTALLAAGAVMAEPLLDRRARLRAAVFPLVTVSGLVLAPLYMPILPVETYIRYAAALPMGPIINERGQLGVLPQFFADMQGWHYRVEKIAAAYKSLPDSDQAVCVLGFGNCGLAGAVDFLGRQYGLPRAIATHNSYWLWGPGERSGEVMITSSNDPDGLRALYREVTEVGRLSHRYGLPGRNEGIYVCRRLRTPLKEIWPRLKHYE